MPTYPDYVMALTDAQILGLLQVLLIQQRDMLEMQAQIAALRSALIGVCGQEIVDPLNQERERFLSQTNQSGSPLSIAAIEAVIAELLPTTGSKN